MRQDAGLKREDNSGLGAGPRILQTSCCTNEGNESRNRRYHQLKCSESNSGELRLDYVPNFHCRSLPTRSRKTSAEQSIVGKRGSMYQSSSEISRIRKIQEGRRKIDSAFDGDAFLLFDIVDTSSRPSTSGAYLHSHRNRSSGAKSSVETTHRTNRASKDFLDLSFRELPDDSFKLDRPRLDSTMLKNDGGDGFLEVSFEKEIIEGGPCRHAAPCSQDVESVKCTETVYQLKTSGCPTENDYGDRGRNSASSSKSISAKVSSSDGTCPSGSVQHIIENNSKPRSSPFKKMLDPIMKSKSRRSPSLIEKGDPNSITGAGSRKNSMPRKSLLGDFSRTEQASNCQPNGEIQCITSALSPAHLQAVLRLDSKNGVQVSEFCVEGLEESISARNWKTVNELNSIYTFHSGGKRSSAAGRISKDGGLNLPPIVGQLQVSSYLCPEVGKGGIVNKVITEFVSYDIAHARRFVEKTQCTETPQQPLGSAIDKSISGESPQMINLMDQHKIGRNNSDVSSSCPWSEEDLYPHLEIAATVIEVPFSKDKSKEVKNGSSPCTVKVVTPSGLHGLPSESEANPSPLLDRWRYGGGCDCGGWDMACPIDVLGNAYDDNWAESITTNAKHPVELFVQGSKEELPALSMKANGKGQFLVDFHARLSALQAFSVCISLLHCSEASIAISIEKGKHKLYSSSLKLLLEEDVRHLIEAVTAEEKKQKKKSLREKAPPSVVLDPPFSPIGRV
ncbi:unnamed protein product [Urochloa decumbens]|uniref:Uncharacterized protein n=1 Tax=Urochloa decumbens TaxID=240449 RepID=A0ABC8Z947_9POAL